MAQSSHSNVCQKETKQQQQTHTQQKTKEQQQQRVGCSNVKQMFLINKFSK